MSQCEQQMPKSESMFGIEHIHDWPCLHGTTTNGLLTLMAE